MTAEDTLRSFLRGQNSPFYLSVRILPGAQRTEIVTLMDDGETWKIRVSAPPEKGKANAELKKLFRKTFGLNAEVISGKTDRTKLLKISE